MAEHGEGLCTRVFADPAGSLLKRDSQDPRQGVLDTPGLPHGVGKPPGVGWPRRQNIPGLDRDLVP